MELFALYEDTMRSTGPDHLLCGREQWKSECRKDFQRNNLRHHENEIRDLGTTKIKARWLTDKRTEGVRPATKRLFAPIQLAQFEIGKDRRGER